MPCETYEGQADSKRAMRRLQLIKLREYLSKRKMQSRKVYEEKVTALNQTLAESRKGSLEDLEECVLINQHRDRIIIKESLGC